MRVRRDGLPDEQPADTGDLLTDPARTPGPQVPRALLQRRPPRLLRPSELACGERCTVRQDKPRHAATATEEPLARTTTNYTFALPPLGTGQENHSRSATSRPPWNRPRTNADAQDEGRAPSS